VVKFNYISLPLNQGHFFYYLLFKKISFVYILIFEKGLFHFASIFIYVSKHLLLLEKCFHRKL
jgi:hypothetical protein